MPSTQLKVKELLKERGWTTKILAEKTGMSESYLTHIKNSTRRWNEDSLNKIAHAFSVEPVALFSSYSIALQEPQIENHVENTSGINPKKPLSLSVKKVPMMGDIPLYPSDHNNQTCQILSGYKEMFAPVLGVKSDNMFCFVLENQSLAPRFFKGDCLVVAPDIEVKTGDIAAVELKSENKALKGFFKVSFSENLALFEHVAHKNPPVALIKNRDYYRIIGKVVYIYQKFV